MTDQTRTVRIGTQFTNQGETITGSNVVARINYEDAALRETLKGRGYRYSGGEWFSGVLSVEDVRREIDWLASQGVALARPSGLSRRFYREVLTAEQLAQAV